VITFITTIIAGLEWTTGKIGPYEFNDLKLGLPYAISIIFILACHEFGHYFAAKYHKVKATLPYFIPFPPIPGFFNFGTMGAVIRTKSITPNNKAMFDIGVAGPISGFIACLIVLIYGFTHLPPVDYILTIHPDYFSPDYGKNAVNLEFGSTLIFELLKNLFSNPNDFIPPMSEVYHYPYLCVGWFGLFVTAMNLIPVGQLDGGHIIYSMFGEKVHEAVASISMIILMLLGAGGILSSFLGFHFELGWSGWLFWALILYFFIKVKHPPVPHFEKLDRKRMILGYIAIAIFILSFSPTPFIISL
ncbi:MAG: site-2 protease family protein, partial [Melioribacter sp.]|nr:site-2 protease family protein [Melioribacter sp.]